jgi:hypothetical protein
MTARRLAAVLVFAVLTASGCQLFRSTEPPTVKTGPDVQPPSEPAGPGPEAAVPEVEEPSEFERLAAKGSEAAAEGDVASATAFLERALALGDADAEGQELVLLRLALFHADPASPVYESDRALVELRRIVAEYPLTLAGGVSGSLLRLLEEEGESRTERESLRALVSELVKRLEEVEATLARREQEMEKIKEILLQGADATP